MCVVARLPRFNLPGQPQHVIQRGNNKSRLFETPRDYLRFKECLRSAIMRTGCQIHAYVLMTNHVHLLMSQDERLGIAKVMQSVGGRYVRYFNHRLERTGTLWEGRYRATVINSEEYFFTCCRYIEENPVRAGMVGHPADYRWSSFAVNALGAEDSLVTPHERYLTLGLTPQSRRVAYAALFLDTVERSTMAAIRDATNHGWALGNEQFQRVISADRRSSRKRPSRCPIRCLTP